MLFELFLVAAITILPISLAILVVGLAEGCEKHIKPCVIAIAIALMCSLLAVALPPIPIIPQ